MIKAKPLIISLIISLGLGGLAGWLTSGSQELYKSLHLPALAPPAIVFPIVWTALYVLMGISAYLIYMSDEKGKSTALTLYGIQLVVNFVWPLLFFNFQAYFESFLWLLLLLALILAMLAAFWKVRPLAAWLQMPYLVWAAFAVYLNLGVWLLNR